MGNIIGWILIVPSIFLVAWGIAELLKLAFSQGCGFGLLCLIFPVLFIAFLGNEKGQKAWGSLSLGIILLFIGWLMTGGT